MKNWRRRSPGKGQGSGVRGEGPLTRLAVCSPSARQNCARVREEEAVVLSTRHLQQQPALSRVPR